MCCIGSLVPAVLVLGTYFVRRYGKAAVLAVLYRIRYLCVGVLLVFLGCWLMFDMRMDIGLLLLLTGLFGMMPLGLYSLAYATDPRLAAGLWLWWFFMLGSLVIYGFFTFMQVLSMLEGGRSAGKAAFELTVLTTIGWEQFRFLWAVRRPDPASRRMAWLVGILIMLGMFVLGFLLSLLR